MAERSGPNYFEVRGIPVVQPIYDEFEDVQVDSRRGTLVILEEVNSDGGPLWKRFVPERDASYGIRIPFYEARIKRAKKKAAKYASSIAYEIIEVTSS